MYTTCLSCSHLHMAAYMYMYRMMCTHVHVHVHTFQAQQKHLEVGPATEQPGGSPHFALNQHAASAMDSRLQYYTGVYMCILSVRSTLLALSRLMTIKGAGQFSGKNRSSSRWIYRTCPATPAIHMDMWLCCNSQEARGSCKDYGRSCLLLLLFLFGQWVALL